MRMHDQICTANLYLSSIPAGRPVHAWLVSIVSPIPTLPSYTALLCTRFAIPFLPSQSLTHTHGMFFFFSFLSPFFSLRFSTPTGPGANRAYPWGLYVIDCS